MRGDVDSDDGAAAARNAGTEHQPRGPKQLDALLKALADARAQANVDTAVGGAGRGRRRRRRRGRRALALGAVGSAAPPSALGGSDRASAREERRRWRRDWSNCFCRALAR